MRNPYTSVACRARHDHRKAPQTRDPRSTRKAGRPGGATPIPRAHLEIEASSVSDPGRVGIPSVHRRRQGDGARSGLTRAERSGAFSSSSRWGPRAPATAIVGNVGKDSSTLSPASFTLRPRHSGRTGVANAITGLLASSSVRRPGEGATRGERHNTAAGLATPRSRHHVSVRACVAFVQPFFPVIPVCPAPASCRTHGCTRCRIFARHP